ncbi:hypothetical protein HY212_06530 [Candidatus Pacearchaeota archaeon]|nr:hypothetical protein [Candidatus Pacearchaeota archaeon]
MITYNDIYEAKKNPLVLFESPLNTEGGYHLIAFDGYPIASLGKMIK